MAIIVMLLFLTVPYCGSVPFAYVEPFGCRHLCECPLHILGSRPSLIYRILHVYTVLYTLISFLLWHFCFLLSCSFWSLDFLTFPRLFLLPLLYLSFLLSLVFVDLYQSRIWRWWLPSAGWPAQGLLFYSVLGATTTVAQDLSFSYQLSCIYFFISCISLLFSFKNLLFSSKTFWIFVAWAPSSFLLFI